MEGKPSSQIKRKQAWFERIEVSKIVIRRPSQGSDSVTLMFSQLVGSF